MHLPIRLTGPRQGRRTVKVSVSYWRVVFFFLLLLLLLLPLLLLLLPPVVLTVPVLAAVLSSVRKLDCTPHQ